MLRSGTHPNTFDPATQRNQGVTCSALILLISFRAWDEEVDRHDVDGAVIGEAVSRDHEIGTCGELQQALARHTSLHGVGGGGCIQRSSLNQGGSGHRIAHRSLVTS